MLNVTAPVAIKNVLVATDFSPLWKLAMPFVSDIARRYRANLTLLHVIPSATHPELPLAPTLPSEEEKKERERVLAKLASVADEIDVPYLQKAKIVRVGDPVQAAVDAVTDRHIDLVVLTTHGRVGLSRLVLGSTAEHILRRVPCPVLTIGPKTNQALRFEDISTILVPVDFSGESTHAAYYAVGLAQQHRAKIILLHIIDHTLPPYQIDSEETFANREILNIDTDELEAERIVRVGAVEEAIVAAASEYSATCLVMGRHKHGVLSTHLPFTTLRSVLLHAPCPVFTVA